MSTDKKISTHRCFAFDHIESRFKSQEDAYRTPRERVFLAVAVLATFLVAEFVGDLLKEPFLQSSTGWKRLGWFSLFIYTPRLVLPALLIAVVFRPSRLWRVLGVDRPALPALLFALIVSTPMAIALAMSFDTIPSDELLYAVARGAVAPGFTEEIHFRAFFFGILFRFVGIGFLPAALGTSIVFGGLHAWQGNDLLEVSMVVMITGIGGLWFAWLFTEWRFNTWVPVSIHIVMNALWEVFDVSDSALGNHLVADLSRLVVIVLSIVGTWALTRRSGGFILSRGNLLWGYPATSRFREH